MVSRENGHDRRHLWPILTLLLCLSLFQALGQARAAAFTPARQEGPDSAAGPTVFLRLDPEVNPYTVPPPQRYLSGRAAAANILVNYNGSGWSSEARGAFQVAVDIWQTLINSTVPIVVNAAFEPLNPGVLGGAGPATIHRNFSNAPIPDTWYPQAAANRLAGKDLAPTSADINATFSSAFGSWYFGAGETTPVNKINFTSVVMHELGHGLGFIGSMSVTNGLGSYGQIGSPYIYDRFTENGAGTALLDFPNNSAALAAQLTSNNITFDGPKARLANGGDRVALYAPSTWKSGSSYSHLAESFNNTPNALMTFSIGYGETVYDPGPVVLCMFKDMGWSITGSCPPPLLLQNGDFEAGRQGWSESSGHGWPLIYGPGELPVAAHNGQWAAWLGGGQNEIARLEQTVTVPVKAPYYTYWRWIQSNETNCSGVDGASVLVGSTPVDSYPLCDTANSGGWVEVAVDLRSYSGQTVPLTFEARTGETLTSNLYIDDVSFKSYPILPEHHYLPLIE